MRIRFALLATFLLAPAILMGPLPALASDVPAPTASTAVQDESSSDAATCCASIPPSISYKTISISYYANYNNPVQKKTVDAAAGTSKTETSGWLFSWEPFKGAHIDCYIVRLT